ncbi:EAL domain-containing protein [Planococcus sp. 1R117A]|uniref:EAL domain-containing protein n=1 Tax=Planococcus sp. 1R117A TaxID=3447020 RepID=UPI003EDB8D9F
MTVQNGITKEPYEYLGAKPFNVLKLNISLIRQISSNFRKAIIVESIINLAKKLNLRVVAEGVEMES